MTNYENLLNKFSNDKGELSHSPPKSDVSGKKKYHPIKQSDFDEKLPTENANNGLM
jgi:hypothetical protein